jgi:hypothetical protein
VCIMISDTVYYYASGCFFWYLVEVVWSHECFLCITL